MEKKDKYHNGMAKRQLISFDWAMKSILRNKENFDILEGFLQELTGEELEILELLESESNAEQFNQKVNRVDLLAKDKNDVRIFIELQFVKEIDYFQRMLFGTSKIITENLESGNEYSQVKRILSIHIVYFDLGHGTDYIYKGSTNFVGLHDGSLLELNNSQKEQFKLSFVSEIFPQYYVIRIGNYDDQVNNTLDEWVYFLKNDSIDDLKKLILHEYVHVCVASIGDCKTEWLDESLATFLSGQKPQKIAKCTLNELKNDENLTYSTYYFIGKVIVETFSFKEIYDMILDENTVKNNIEIVYKKLQMQ